MNTRLLHYACLTLLIGGMSLCASGAGLTVSPSVVTNDAFGQIALTITGVSGQTVLVEKFYDLNNSGTVDAGDLLMQSFRVTDGLIPTLGGVTNLNVPGDADGVVNGQIQVALNYPGLDSIYSRIEGLWLFRISSPTSAFTPVTQPFRVWQKTLPLSISGTVSAGVDFLTNALVVAFDSNFSPVGGSRVKSSGRYTIYAPAGEYTVWPFLNGYIANQSGGSGIIRQGQSVTNADILMTTGTTRLSGKLADSATGAGLAGVGLIGYQGTSTFATAFTDAGGNYTLSVTPNLWQVSYTAEQMPLLGYVAAAIMPTTNVSGDVSGFDLSATRATTLIYGTMTDDQLPANKLTNVTVTAQDVAGLYSASGMTYRTNGNYTIGVVAGNWWIAPESDSLSSLGYLGNDTNWVTGKQQPARIDILARKITAHLKGSLKDDYGYAMSYATVQATDSTGEWSAKTTSDLTGQFDLGVFAGTWNLSPDYDTAINYYVNGTLAAYAVTNNQTLTGISYVMRYSTADIYGSIRDENNTPVAGITVQGLGTNYSLKTATDATGNFYANAAAGPLTLNLNCFGSESLSWHGYECAPATLATLTGGANNLPAIGVTHFVAPNFTATTRLPGGIFTTLVSGPTNRTFQVLSSSNLTDWLTIFATNPPQGNFEFSNSYVPGPGQLFFRALAQ